MSISPKLTAPSLLEWVRPPQQARTRESLERFLDEAEGLVAERGFDAVGIIEIAQQASSSVGSFYRRFRDKDGLLHALHERFCAEARATADAALDPERWVGVTTPDVLTEFTIFLVRIYREREGLLRAFLNRGTADKTVRGRNNQLFEHIADRLRQLLKDRSADLSHPDPHLAASFGLHAVLGTLNHIVQTQPESLRLSDARVAAELGRVLRNYLGAESTRPHLRRTR
jgi:AcrR family transcriptional regulator